MTSIFWQPISQEMHQVLNSFSMSEIGSRFYLAGGYYGYGYPMVGEFVQAEEARLASIADIGLMKLNALLGRASRKDFIDLTFICQHIPLRKLLDLAPQKYPSIRDFESQAVRRLVYFDRAEQEEEIPLLQPIITWGEVKQYFRDQAKTLGRGWFGH